MTTADVRAAVLRLYAAAEDARAVSELPAQIGARVTWANGMVWERIGEDEWEPVDFGRGDALKGWMPADIETYRAPSLHIASGTIVAVEPAQ